MTIRRIDQSKSKELRKIGRAGIEDAPPAGISPVLRASWRFARDTAERFNKELLNDRTKEFLKSLARKFS
ncbi:MAG: hypothetical protein ABIH50_00760 [bacterium]